MNSQSEAKQLSTFQPLKLRCIKASTNHEWPPLIALLRFFRVYTGLFPAILHVTQGERDEIPHTREAGLLVVGSISKNTG